MSNCKLYNGYQSGAHCSSSICGFGWKLNYDRRIYYLDPSASALNKQLYDWGYHYKYVDGDGTELYLKHKGNNIYEDELGKGITCSSTNGIFTMTDKQDNKQFLTAEES